MQTLSAPLSALLVDGVQCFASCWLVKRADGVALRFTDHDLPLLFDDKHPQLASAAWFVSNGGGHPSGDALINVGGMVAESEFIPGEQIRFNGHSMTYTVWLATPASISGVGTIIISPALKQPVAVNEGITQVRSVYIPLSSINASSRQRTANLKSRNLDVLGVLDHDSITHSDLRTGKYQEAKFTEYLIDWRFPHEGAISKSSYWMSSLQFDGETWQATVEGVARFLQQTIGRRYNKTCRHVLGDSKCQKALGPFTVSGTVITAGVTVQRSVIKTDVPMANGVYDYGNITFTSGANKGASVEIRQSFATAGRLVFMLKTPYDIADGDGFSLVQGCDKSINTCKVKFANAVNFGGFPFIPGTDKAFTTPSVK